MAGEVSTRKACHTKLIGFLNQVKAHSVTPLNYHALKTISDRARKTMEKAEGAHYKLIAAETTDAGIALQESAFSPLEGTFQELEMLTALAISSLPTAAPGSSGGPPPGGAVSVKLPAIELPTFDGNFANWMSFKDLFSATVGTNTHLSAAQKLQYLKSALQGEPANLIKAMVITDANYVESWTILNDRYDNKREIVHSLISKITNYKRLSVESAQELQALSDCVSESLRSLKVLSCPTDKWDDVLIVLLISKLDSATRREWAIRQTSANLPTIADFTTFLSSHIRGLLATGVPPQSASRKDKQVRVNHVSSQPNSCAMCSGSHPHHQCTDYINLSITDRLSAIKQHRLCFNCLSKDHQLKKCPSKRSCHKCGKRHHTTLHDDNTKPSSGGTSTATNNIKHPHHPQQQSSSTIQTNHINIESSVALKTAVVHVRDKFQNLQLCRVFIDDGSQGEFISEACVARLQLRRQFGTVTVNGFGNTRIGRTRGQVELMLVSRLDSTQSITIKAHVLPKLATVMPCVKYRVEQYQHLKGLQLADPKWFVPGQIDITLGAKYFPRVIGKDRVEGQVNEPVAFHSMFGWIVSGVVHPASPSRFITSCQVTINPDIDFLRRFWEIEEPPKPVRCLTEEERACEEHFLNTYARDELGRFHVAIPFNGSESRLGLSRDAAIRRLKQVEARLNRQPEHLNQYVSFMKEYVALGHMELIPPDQCVDIPGKTFYLPHHFVVNESSSTTKLRVVFDGSAKSSTGISLNDCMMVGARTQDDLYDILLRFRAYSSAMKADIAKMFRQFRLQNQDVDYHRIVWRESPQESVKDYRLLTVTYGTACATFLSTRCIEQLAKDVRESYPLASAALHKSVFVDDLLHGSSSQEMATRTYEELSTAVSEAGMELRKWSSNDPDLLAVIPRDKQEEAPRSFGDLPIKALGVCWYPDRDVFKFSTYKFGGSALTKRILLSELSKVFDPLGFISCVTVRAKLILQELWKLSIDWDESVPDYIETGWVKYKEDLHHLANVSIPRQIMFCDIITMELHAFADASLRATGQIVYLRSVTENEVRVRMVTSKTRVAPLKPVSIPRLELCAAVDAAKLLVSVRETLQLKCQVYLWSDSKITLAWIASSPSRWKTFVCHRVSRIQELTPIDAWRHVPGTENPADLASRGISVAEVINNSLWFNGPSWLCEEKLPTSSGDQQPDTDMIRTEERTKPVQMFNVEIVEPDILGRFSSLVRLKRVTCYILRFYLSWKTKTKKNGSLDPLELKEAFLLWVRLIQQQHFHQDHQHLQKNGKVTVNSKLRKLSPFIDATGIIRVGGRLYNAPVSDATKHQIVLPRSTHLVYLLVHHFHHSLFHAGFQHVWASLQREFWIVGGRDRVRCIIRSCVTCRRYGENAATQIMGNLPEARVTPSRPFLSTGVDFCGPFTFRNPVGRAPKTYKGYLCVFICMVSKAIHLEAVSSLSSEAFLDSLRRFVSRRGLCTDIYSDCGTNFVGADRELKRLMQAKDTQEKISNSLSNQSIRWHFNPPSSPHHGGLWEAAVKSAKFHLKRVLGNNNITYEDFCTVICQVEAVLNSRPLTPFSSDPGDVTALTPGHFLVGESLTAIPAPNLVDVPSNRLNRYQALQQRLQHFWRRWSQEYIHTLQQRSKWLCEKENVQVGDLVLLKEESSPGTWKLARIVKVHQGSDGKVRVATVKTSSNVLQRPIVKLIPLLKKI